MLCASLINSLLQLLAKRDPTDDDFLQDLHKCGWLEHIRGVMGTAARVKDLIHVERSSVLVHCSDGWDRTAQISILVQLLLDPHYRTLDGLAALLQKDLLAFGHKCAERLGHAAGAAVIKDQHIGVEGRVAHGVTSSRTVSGGRPITARSPFTSTGLSSSLG